MLALASLALACPSADWLARPGSNSCYAKNGHASQANCNAQCATLHADATLVCIEDQDEQEFIDAHFGATSSCCGWGTDYSCCTWLGLYQDPTDQGSAVGWEHWRDATCTSTFRNWNPGEPNDYSGSEDCAFFGWDGHSTWSDAGCDAGFACLCELQAPPAPPPEAAAECPLVLNPTALSWAEAEAHCVTLGGHLVTPTSSAVAAYIEREIVRKGGGCVAVWIGFSDAGVEGEWVWADGANQTWVTQFRLDENQISKRRAVNYISKGLKKK